MESFASFWSSPPETVVPPAAPVPEEEEGATLSLNMPLAPMARDEGIHQIRTRRPIAMVSEERTLEEGGGDGGGGEEDDGGGGGDKISVITLAVQAIEEHYPTSNGRVQNYQQLYFNMVRNGEQPVPGYPVSWLTTKHPFWKILFSMYHMNCVAVCRPFVDGDGSEHAWLAIYNRDLDPMILNLFQKLQDSNSH